MRRESFRVRVRELPFPSPQLPPELTDPRLGRVHVDYDEADRWLVVRRGRLRVVANLGPRSQPVPLDRPAAAVLATSAPGVTTDSDVITVPATSITIIET